MNLTEQKFWQLIKDKLPGEANRVENSADDGTPDISAAFILDYWVELKVCDNINKERDVTKLLRDSQIVWNIRRGKYGSIIFVMVRYPSWLVIYKWTPENFRGILNNIQSAYTKLAVIERKKNSFDWEKFQKVIVDIIKERIKNWST